MAKKCKKLITDYEANYLSNYIPMIEIKERFKIITKIEMREKVKELRDKRMSKHVIGARLDLSQNQVYTFLREISGRQGIKKTQGMHVSEITPSVNIQTLMGYIKTVRNKAKERGKAFCSRDALLSHITEKSGVFMSEKTLKVLLNSYGIDWMSVREVRA